MPSVTRFSLREANRAMTASVPRTGKTMQIANSARDREVLSGAPGDGVDIFDRCNAKSLRG